MDDLKKMEEAAAALLDDRVQYVKDLIRAAQRSEEAEAQAAEARSSHRKAWTAALRAGWSEKELKQVGVTSPDKTKRSPRKKTTETTPRHEGSSHEERSEQSTRDESSPVEGSSEQPHTPDGETM